MIDELPSQYLSCGILGDATDKSDTPYLLVWSNLQIQFNEIREKGWVVYGFGPGKTPCQFAMCYSTGTSHLIELCYPSKL